MDDAGKFVQVALYERLNGAIQGVSVYSQPPFESSPPVIVLGRIRTERLATKTKSKDRIDIEIEIYWTEEGALRGRELLALVRERIEYWPISAPGYSLSSPLFLESDDEELGDGILHIGRARFFVYSQPN